MSDVGKEDVFFDGCEMPMSHGQDVVKGDYDGLYVIYFFFSLDFTGMACAYQRLRSAWSLTACCRESGRCGKKVMPVMRSTSAMVLT